MPAKISDEVVIARVNARGVEVVEYGGNTNAVSLLRCQVCRHEWSTSPAKITGGGGCPKCANKRRSESKCFSLEQALAVLEGKPIELLEYGGKVASKSRLKCTTCEYEWRTSLNSIQNGTGCPKCANRLKLNHKDIEERLRGRNIVLLAYGSNTQDKAAFMCTAEGCGHTWSAAPASVLAGRGCAACSNVLRVTYEEAFRRVSGRNIELLEFSGSAGTKSKFRCSAPCCGYEWAATLHNVTRTAKGGCPKCSGKLPLTTEEVIGRLAGRPIELLEYAGAVAKKSLFRCKNDGCGHEWSAAFNNIQAGQGCPKCAKYGYKIHLPTTVYVYKITKPGEQYVGFGITNKLRIRASRHKSQLTKAGFDSNLIYSYETDGPTALRIEGDLKHNLEITDIGVPGFQREAAAYSEASIAIVNAILRANLTLDKTPITV